MRLPTASRSFSARVRGRAPADELPQAGRCERPREDPTGGRSRVRGRAWSGFRQFHTKRYTSVMIDFSFYSVGIPDQVHERLYLTAVAAASARLA